MTRKVYRERGLKNLVLRVSSYGVDFVKASFIGSGDVLYVSGCPGGSRLYRCVNQAEELSRYGLKSVIISQDMLRISVVKKFRAFVFQRVVFNKHIRHMMDEIKRQGKPILFETDDLVFDPSYLPQMDYYNHMGAEEKSWYDNGIGREVLEDPYVRECIVSTDFLAEAMKKRYPDKQVFVLYNKLNQKQVKMAEKAFARKQSLMSRDGKIRIGYFSGSKSHNRDFEVVAPILLKKLQADKNIILRVVGHLDLGMEFDAVKDQIEVIRFVSLKKLQELIASVDINIAPLEIENPFCQAKSALKYFESGILGVPTVATATSDFTRCIRDGANGFVAYNVTDWDEKLTQLIEDTSLREAMGLVAREDTLLHHTTATKDKSTSMLAEILARKDRNVVSTKA